MPGAITTKPLSRVQVFKCSGKPNCYQGQSSLFEGSRSQASIDDEDTTVTKGGDHHEGQLRYEFRTKMGLIFPRSTTFSLPVAIS